MAPTPVTSSRCGWLLVLLLFCLVIRSSSCHVLGKSTSMCNYKFLQKFLVYWNVPTDNCLRYNISFANLREDFCIIQNSNDTFRGDSIAILYDPGSFPTLKNDYDEDLMRNGGAPQISNLTLHLEEFQRDVDRWIPDRDFSGLAVIDFELWRPVYRQLWGKYEIYKSLSVRIERQKHPDWSDRHIIDEASRSFEKAAKMFMAETLRFAREIRPNAKWGYYGYPFCNNWSSGNRHDHCPNTVVRENDQMSWLYNNISLLMPSVYLNPDLSVDQRIGMVRGRVRESVRIANSRSDRENVKVLPYFWYRYRKRNIFVEKTELENTLKEVAKNGGDGVIIWGMRDDMDSRSKCEDLYNFVYQILGPIILNIKTQNEF